MKTTTTKKGATMNTAKTITKKGATMNTAKTITKKGATMNTAKNENNIIENSFKNELLLIDKKALNNNVEIIKDYKKVIITYIKSLNGDNTKKIINKTYKKSSYNKNLLLFLVNNSINKFNFSDTIISKFNNNILLKINKILLEISTNEKLSNTQKMDKIKALKSGINKV